MNKETWLKHMIEITELIPPSQGGNRELWRAAIKQHLAPVGIHMKNHVPCDICKARSKTRAASIRVSMRAEAMRSLGLVSYRNGCGTVCWE